MLEFDYVNSALLPPGMDFITETGLSGERFVDTGRVYDPGVLTYLNGRKYVSYSTFLSLANAFGVTICDGACRSCQCDDADASGAEGSDAGSDGGAEVDPVPSDSDPKPEVVAKRGRRGQASD